MTDSLATIGALIKVSPIDEIQYSYSYENFGMISDYSPFHFRVGGKLFDNEFLFGVYGPITAGHQRYSGLICSLIMRVEPCDWNLDTKSSAFFKIGPTRVFRNEEFDFDDHPDLAYWFVHPDATKVKGYPSFSRAGDIEVVKG